MDDEIVKAAAQAHHYQYPVLTSGLHCRVPSIARDIVLEQHYVIGAPSSPAQQQHQLLSFCTPPAPSSVQRYRNPLCLSVRTAVELVGRYQVWWSQTYPGRYPLGCPQAVDRYSELPHISTVQQHPRTGPTWLLKQ